MKGNRPGPLVFSWNGRNPVDVKVVEAEVLVILLSVFGMKVGDWLLLMVGVMEKVLEGLMVKVEEVEVVVVLLVSIKCGLEIDVLGV